MQDLMLQWVLEENLNRKAKFLGATSTFILANIKFSNDNPFTSQQDDAAYDKIKRFDFGLNFGGGLDLGKVLLKVNYGFGLTKINSTQSNNSTDDKNKYRTLSISLGIPLNKGLTKNSLSKR